MGDWDWLYSKDRGVLGLGIGGDGGLLGTGIIGSGDTPTTNQAEDAGKIVQPIDAEANNVYQQALGQAASANAIQAPQAINPQSIDASLVNQGAYNVATNQIPTQVSDASSRLQTYNATLGMASNAAVNNLSKADVTKAQAAPAAGVGNVSTEINAPTIGPAAQTGATDVERTTLNPMADDLRDQQIRAANAIAQAPSAAMSQFQAGQSQVVKDQLAAAAGARGSDRAGARRDAMLAIGAGGAQQNLSAAALSAQEEQSKLTASSAALGGIRSTDVTSATNAAAVTSQQQDLQAQIDAATAQGNTTAVNQLKGQQATLTLQAKQAQVQAGLTQQGTQAGLATANLSAQEQTNLANAAAANASANNYSSAANSAYANLAANQTAVSQANAAATTGASAANTNAYNAALQTTATAQTAANQFNASLAQSQEQANANRAAGLATTNASGINAANTANASNDLAAQTTTGNQQLTAEQLKQQAATANLNTANAAIGSQMTGAENVIGADNSDQTLKRQGQAQANAGLLGGIGTVFGGYAAASGKSSAPDGPTSDERAKTDLSSVGSGRISFADQYGAQMASEYGLTPASASPYGAVGGKPKASLSGGGGNTSAAGSVIPALISKISDERTKNQVDRMDDKDVVSQAEKFPLVTFRYKNGVEDGGAYAHVGSVAQGLEKAGPLGKMVVSEGPDGFKRVDYGALAYVTAKAALAKAGRKEAR
jgi:hypothetical protein